MSSNGNIGSWADARQTASWRGVPFRVRDSEVKRGRRQAVHEYPFRDEIWVEDLGRGTRVTSFRGFIVGDDVDQQLQDLIGAAETPGDGTLVHPALGAFVASCVGFAASEGVERGRVWEVEFEFLSGSARLYPAATANTQGQVLAAATAASAFAASSFGSSLGGVLQQGASVLPAGIAQVGQVVAGVQATIGGVVGQALGAVGSVPVLAGALAGLSGNFGRFSLGARLASIPGLGSVDSALGSANAAAGAVAGFGSAATGAAALVGNPFTTPPSAFDGPGFGSPGTGSAPGTGAGQPANRYGLYTAGSDGYTPAQRTSMLQQDAAYFKANGK